MKETTSAISAGKSSEAEERGKASRVWAEISLPNLIYNYRQIAKQNPGKEVICIVKADAYGHGATHCAQALQAAGAANFAVATAEEALELRAAGISGFLLLLGPAPMGHIRSLARENVTMAAVSFDHALRISNALEPGQIARVHVKVDTGMSRLGIAYSEAAFEAQKISKLPNIKVDGIFTHFAVADEDEAFTALQVDRIKQVLGELKMAGFTGLKVHCSASSGILSVDSGFDNMIRPGIMLYGFAEGLKPVMSLNATIVQLKWVAPGDTVSYGRRWAATRPTKIAVISAGYADGILRSGSGKLEVLAGGKRAKQVGTICMDMVMLDVTDIEDIAEGDVVTFFGDGPITAQDVAEWSGTIPYEIVCAVSRRVPRFYIEA